jgi:hypothetical protein
MPAQRRDPGKNYIGIVNDRVDEQRAVASPAKPDRVVRDFFVAVMAAVLRRQRGART